jgi:flagellar biosynthesis protein FlhA
MKYKDIIIVLIIIAMIIMMIIPIKSFFLDIFLTFNISLALVILLITMYINESLEFSIFPSVLLITTLLRLSLNVSSTRLILGAGYAGKVIETFGNFVIGGDPVVGFIIFLIIIIIQFLVITKGAERVAEVAARFTLDAMPGKQMSIDADLNSGLINEIDAKNRRQKIQREADFYGAMDGASKFVKGDAIASIIITLINIMGGFLIGMVIKQEGDFGFVLQKYTLLTVGDGLVSQIPALLISTATGIIVTRASSESNLGEELSAQIFSNHRVLFIAAFIIFALGTFTPLPFFAFSILSLFLVLTGVNLIGKSRLQMASTIEKEEKEVEQLRSLDNVQSLLSIDPMELEFGYGVIPLADVNQGGDLLDRVVMIRRQIAMDLGMILPVIRLRDNIQLKPNQYVIKIKGIEVAMGEIYIDHYLAMNPGTAEEEIVGINTIEPAFGLPATWISREQKDQAEILGYTLVDPSSVISTHLTEIAKKHAHELLGRQEVKKLLDSLKESYPALVDEVTPKLLSLGDIHKVLTNLLREGIPIRDMVTILETLADYSIMTKDNDILTEYVRQALFRVITKLVTQGSSSLSVITIESKLEQTIMDSLQHTERGSYLSLDPATIQKIINSVKNEFNKLLEKGMTPVILTSPIIRPYFKRLLDSYLDDLIVISYNELDPKLEVISVGMVIK